MVRVVVWETVVQANVDKSFVIVGKLICFANVMVLV